MGDEVYQVLRAFLGQTGACGILAGKPFQVDMPSAGDEATKYDYAAEQFEEEVGDDRQQ